jgi:hypothetical protein
VVVYFPFIDLRCYAGNEPHGHSTWMTPRIPIGWYDGCLDPFFI